MRAMHIKKKICGRVSTAHLSIEIHETLQSKLQSEYHFFPLFSMKQQKKTRLEYVCLFVSFLQLHFLSEEMKNSTQMNECFWARLSAYKQFWFVQSFVMDKRRSLNAFDGYRRE